MLIPLRFSSLISSTSFPLNRRSLLWASEKGLAPPSEGWEVFNRHYGDFCTGADNYEMRKYIAPVESQASRPGVCVGRSTQTADTLASTGLLRLEFERLGEGISIALVERQRKIAWDIPEGTWEPHDKHERLTTESNCQLAFIYFPNSAKNRFRRRARA
jgi:hypothetical protein